MRCLYAKAVFGEEEKKAVAKVLEDGWLGEGKRVAEFETAVRMFVGKKFAVAVNSGSSANLLALLSLGLPAGGEVITPALTFNTTISPIIQAGLKPVFVDVDPGLYVVKAEDVIAAYVPGRTVAVMVPHLIGNCAEIDAIASFCEEKGLKLVEDCCDTLGSHFRGRVAGSFGDVSTFSFYASHHITAGGGGGMLLTDDAVIWEKAMSIRDWGRGDVYRADAPQEAVEDTERRFSVTLGGNPYDLKFFYKNLGYNFKMNEMQGAFGAEQMKKIHLFNSKRAHNFHWMSHWMEEFKEEFILPVSFSGASPSWLAFPLTIREGKMDRKELLLHLERSGVQTRMIFSGNVLAHAPFSGMGDASLFPGANSVMRGGFLVGCHHGMEPDVEGQYIFECIAEFVRSKI